MKAQITITNEDAHWLIRNVGMKFRGAYLSETMGPNFKPIVWVICGGTKRPNICLTHTHIQIRKALKS
jgi:hypothetical protein